MVAAEPEERLAAGGAEQAVVSWVLGCVLTSRQGIPTVGAKGRGKSSGHASVNTQPDLDAQKEERSVVVLKDVSSNRIYDCFNVSLAG